MLPRRNHRSSYVNSFLSTCATSEKKYLQRELPAVSKLISPAQKYNANRVTSPSNSCDLLTLLEYNAQRSGWTKYIIVAKQKASPAALIHLRSSSLTCRRTVQQCPANRELCTPPALSSPAHQPRDNPATSLQAEKILFPGILDVNRRVFVAEGPAGRLCVSRFQPVPASSTPDPLQGRAEPMEGARGAPGPIRRACGASVRTRSWNGGNHQRNEQGPHGGAGDTSEGTTAWDRHQSWGNWGGRSSRKKPPCHALPSAPPQAGVWPAGTARGGQSTCGEAEPHNRAGRRFKQFNDCRLGFPISNKIL